MNKISILLAGIGLVSFAGGAANYNLNLNGGKFPSKVGVENVNSLIPLSGMYQHGYTRFGWVVGRFMNEYVAMSPTRTGASERCANRITLPVQEIEPGAILRWTTRSLLEVMPENYYIEALVDGSDIPERVITVKEEPAKWTTHTISIEKYAGRSVVFRMVCDSENAYMLMLKEFFIGVPDATRFDVVNSTAAYTDLTNASVKISATNVGMADESDAIVCLAGEKEFGREQLSGKWETGESRDFEFATEATLNERTQYEVWLEKGGERTVKLAEGSYFSSNFVRRHLVDKGTGTWCSNCPDGILLMEQLEEELGESLVGVETHVGNDPMTNQGYWNELGFYAAPYFKLNRIAESAQSNLSLFANYYDQPVTMGLDVEEMTSTETGATVKLNVRALPDFDNSSDRYRIGYVLVKDFYEPDNGQYSQQSNVTMPSGARFYLLASPVPSEFMKFHNVSLDYEYAFGGIANSIPTVIPEGGSEFEINVEKPERFGSMYGISMAAFILDSETGIVMNAAKSKLYIPIEGVAPVYTESSDKMLEYVGGGFFEVNTDSAYNFSIYNLSGSLVYSMTGKAPTVNVNLPSGIYIARVTSGEKSASLKVVL